MTTAPTAVGEDHEWPLGRTFEGGIQVFAILLGNPQVVATGAQCGIPSTPVDGGANDTDS